MKQLTTPFPVVCVNDSARPNEVPASKWIVKDQQYTVVEISRLAADQGKIGFKLAEINLAGCEPFLFFDARRFRPVIEADPEPLQETNSLVASE